VEYRAWEDKGVSGAGVAEPLPDTEVGGRADAERKGMRTKIFPVLLGVLLLVGIYSMATCAPEELGLYDWSKATLDITGRVERVEMGRCVDTGSVKRGGLLSSASGTEYKDLCVIPIAFTIMQTDPYINLGWGYRLVEEALAELPISGRLVMETDERGLLLSVGDTFYGRLEANDYYDDTEHMKGRIYWRFLRITGIEP